MKKVWPFVVTVLAFIGNTMLAQSNTPEDAFQEFATTDQPVLFERHLPAALQQALDQLPAGQKQQILDKFMVSKLVKRGGITVRATEDPRVFELARENHPSAILTLKNSFVDGTDALLLMEIKDDKSFQVVLVRLQLEDDDWRVEQFGPWDSRALASDELLQEILPVKRNEAAAASLLGMMNNALEKYSRTYPYVGYAPSLRALSGAEGVRPSPDHAFILGSLSEPLIRDGYSFHYSRITGTHYQITASPVEFGKSGGKSFFTDETGIIRCTSEDRPATEADDSLR